MRRSPTVVLLVLVPVLSLLAACGASGGDASPVAKATTTTAASDDEGTDDEPVDKETTTTTAADEDDDNGGSGLTSAALADILPTADEIGAEGYQMSDEDLDDTPEDPTENQDDGSDPTEDAILEACPGAEILNELDSGSSDNPDEVSREFSTKSDQTIEVALDPTADDFTAANVDKVVEALADCGTIKTTDEDGSKIEMTIEAESSDDHGDYGLKMSMDATFDLMGTPLKIEFRGLIFDVDGVTVSVVATSGLDDATFQFVDGDYDVVPGLATEMQDRVAAL